MAEVRIGRLSEREAVNQIVRTVKRAPIGAAPFALVLGSGFSHGLVPVARELVAESLPLWVKSLEDGQSYEDLKQRPQHDRAAIAGDFWQGFVSQNSGRDGFKVVLNSTTNFPENYAEAYQAAFNPKYDGAVNAPKEARDFQRALMQLNKPRLNAAHFLLASLLGVQPGKTIRRNNLFKFNAAFSRLILTTNFDPFLQTALQAVNQLYFMSDTPKLGVSDEIYDDQSEAIHLVYLHGSVHRRDQAATKDAIDEIKKKNAVRLAPVLERHGVIVLGYSGWDDAIVEALAACSSFDNRLYWCGRAVDPLAIGAFGERVPEILQNSNAFYVQVFSAGSFMAQLCTELVRGLPRLIDNPIGQLRELLDIIDLKELEVKPPGSAGPTAPQLLQSESSAMAVVQAQQLTIERLKEAEQVFFGMIPSLPAVETLREQPEQLPVDSRLRDVQPIESTSNIQQLLSSAQFALGLGIYEECIRLCNQALALTSLEASDRAKLMQLRALAHYYSEEFGPAMDDWGRLIELRGAPVEQVAQALYNRGVTWGQQGDTEKEIADYTRVIELPGAAVEQVAEALYNRGVAWGQQGDTEKEIADYTRVIEQLSGVSGEQVAQALVNRGVAWGQQGDEQMEIADYTRVIEQLPEAPVEQVAQALYNRGVAWGQQGDTEKEMADYTRVIELPGAPVEWVAQALYNRGVAWGQQGETEKEIADYTRVIELPGAPVEQVAEALNNRGIAWGRQGNTDREIADYARVIELLGAPVEQVAQALYNRGVAWGQQGEAEKEIADYTRVIELPDVSVEQMAQALNNRGSAWGDPEKEIADYSRVIELPEAPVAQVAEALYNRGVAWRQQGDTEKEIADYTKVIELPDAPVEQKAKALYNRGVTWGQQGDTEKEIADYTRVIELPGAAVEQVAEALYNRGVAWGQQDDTEKEIADYTRLIEQLPEAPVEQVAQALVNRGVAWGQKGDTEKEIADYTRLIEQLPEAPVEQVAQALYNRGVAWGQQGNTEKEMADYTRVIELPGAPVEWLAQALYNRGVAWGQKGDTEKEIADYARVIELPELPDEQVAQALSGRGWVSYQKNDFAGFLAAAEAALGKEPGLDFAAFNLGLALLASGRDADALIAYRAAGERFAESIESLGLEDLREASQKWLTKERARPVIELLKSLKK